MNEEKQIDNEQIAEMVKACPYEDEGYCNICEYHGNKCDLKCDVGVTIRTLAKQGYQKQSEGEWETIPDYSRPLITYRHICSVCKTFYKDIRSQGHTYCHNCGSKMKGGECDMAAIDWYLKCPKCGFAFSIIFDANETEENKKIIRDCPCGAKMKIIEERKIGEW